MGGRRESERLWSIAAKVVVKDRARLDPGLVGDLIFLKENGLITKKYFGDTRVLPCVYEDVTDEEKLEAIAKLIKELEADNDD